MDKDSKGDYHDQVAVSLERQMKGRKGGPQDGVNVLLERKWWENFDKSRAKVGFAEAVKKFALQGTWLHVATRRQVIDDYWNDVKPTSWGKQQFSGEHNILYELLDEDETIEALVGGTFRQDTDRISPHQGVAVATNRRVVFVDKGLLGSTEVMDIAYKNIEALTNSTGLFAAGIQVKGRGTASFRIEDIHDKASVAPFTTCVRKHITDTPSPPAQVSVSLLDELERLARLREANHISQEEYETLKKQLLGS